MSTITPPPAEKTCLKCGIAQPLERFPFRKAEQCYRNTCKACRASESAALRRDPEHGPLIRERERQRSNRRRPAILKWEREHPENMLPGQQRRAARRAARLTSARQVVKALGTGPHAAEAPTRGGRGSKSSGLPPPRP